jgi:hypothetical protein
MADKSFRHYGEVAQRLSAEQRAKFLELCGSTDSEGAQIVAAGHPLPKWQQQQFLTPENVPQYYRDRDALLSGIDDPETRDAVKDALEATNTLGAYKVARKREAIQAGPAAGTVLKLDDPKPDPTRATYSVDCRCVNWYGTVHTFTPTQAACVKVLIEHYKHGVPEVGEQTVLSNEWVETSQQRLASVFENGKHSAWGTMITPGSGKGTFRLTKPGE